MKTEPDECSIDDIATAPKQTVIWDGVRNYQARNFMRAMQLGDQVFIYHSSCRQVGIAGIVEVSRTAFADPSQFDATSPYVDNAYVDNNTASATTAEAARWSAVEVTYLQHLTRLLPLAELKALPALSANPLVRRGQRLSVMPFTDAEWQAVLALQ